MKPENENKIKIISNIKRLHYKLKVICMRCTQKSPSVIMQYDNKMKGLR